VLPAARPRASAGTCLSPSLELSVHPRFARDCSVLFPGALEGISAVVFLAGKEAAFCLFSPGLEISPFALLLAGGFGFLAEHTQTDGSHAFLPMLLLYYKFLFEFSLDFLCCS
jgi:hypothetical protein